MLSPAPSRAKPSTSGRAAGSPAPVGPGALAKTAAARAASPMGTLIRKTDRHPKPLINRPPMAGPRAGAAKNTIPALTGMFAASPSSPKSKPSASGTIGAPTSPCTTRIVISRPMSGASAHAAEASVKPSSTAVYARMVPNRRASQGEAARAPARPSQQPLTVHAAVPSEVCRSRTIPGTATLTTDESTMDSTGPASSVTRMRVLLPGRSGALPARGWPVAITRCSRSSDRVRRQGARPHGGRVGDGRLDDPPAALDDPEPLIRVEISEERNPRVELVVVGEQGGVGIADHRLQQVMAGVSEPVDVARRTSGIRLGGHPLDRALLLEAAQRRVEDVVVDRPPAQDALDTLLDLIAVPLPLREHPQRQYVEVHGVTLT